MREIEIGWMLAVSAWGKGYATEMSRVVLRYGFNKLKLPCIVATIDQRNQRSVTVAKSLGMRFAGIMHVHDRDMFRYKAFLDVRPLHLE